MAIESQKRGWLPAIPEIVAGTAQVIFLLLAVGNKLDPYFIAIIGVILYGILIGNEHPIRYWWYSSSYYQWYNIRTINGYTTIVL
jgi:hypothetical protein